MAKKINDQCGRKRERLFSNICIVPSLVGVLIFFLIPFCIVMAIPHNCQTSQNVI